MPRFWIITVVPLFAALVALSSAAPRFKTKDKIAYLVKSEQPMTSPFGLPASFAGAFEGNDRSDDAIEDVSDGVSVSANLTSGNDTAEEVGDDDNDIADPPALSKSAPSFKMASNPEVRQKNVYGKPNLWYELEGLFFREVQRNNASLQALETSINQEISQLKSALNEATGDIDDLEDKMSNLRTAVNETAPRIGDVKLQFEGKGPLVARGRLLVYTGEEYGWGYVCDDLFFQSESANVACRQLGYNRGIPDIIRNYDAQMATDDNNYTIVLDNVACDSNAPNLMSCPHEDVGVHNCVASEAVDLLCIKD